MRSIWCLMVDQEGVTGPDTLVAWWSDRPALETVAKSIGLNYPTVYPEQGIITSLWTSGKATYNGRSYHLRERPEGSCRSKT